MLESGARPIVLDTATHFWGRSIPGAIALKDSGLGGAPDDQIQARLHQRVGLLTKGDLGQPIVAVGWNSESFDCRNLALRLVELGYANVQWYRGGREAWEAAGRPETQLDEQDW
jgi:adenylate cyclase